MKRIIELKVSFLLLLLVFACSTNKEQLIPVDEVYPWCILGFDSENRTPKQRIAMLKEMGFSQYGYNRGDGRLDQMLEEFELAKENEIEIISVFLWLNAKRDSLSKLSPVNQEMLDKLKQVEHKPTLWLSFSDNFFEGLDQKQSLNRAIEMIKFVKTKSDELGCKLALYNHHGWFGNPHNQVEIIEQLKQDSLKMVYNFHHAHEYLDEFPEIAKKITPYLCNVNIDGVKKEGPQILTVGEGDHEYEMIKTLLDEGFEGPWGILGHIKTEDVKQVLQRNMAGLKALNTQYEEERKQ